MIQNEEKEIVKMRERNGGGISGKMEQEKTKKCHETV